MCLKVGVKLLGGCHIEEPVSLDRDGCTEFMLFQGFSYEEYWSLFFGFVFFDKATLIETSDTAR